MFLEGEVNWALVFGLVAAGAVVFAIMGLWGAARAAVAYRNAAGRLAHAEFTAADADKRLHQTLQAVPVALVETDMSGKFTFANRAAHALLGRRGEELLGLRFHSATWGIAYPDGRLIPPDLLPSARALRGQTVRGFQHVIANPKTRKRMLVSVTALPILNEFGEVTGSSATIVEIDSLIKPDSAEGAVARRVFDVATSSLVVVDREGSIRHLNQPALALLGRAADDVVGRRFTEVFADEAGPESEAAASLILAGEGEPVETGFAAGAGRARLRWRALPLPEGDASEEALVLLAGDEPAPEAEPGPTLEDMQALAAALEAARAEAAQAAEGAQAVERALAEAEQARAQAQSDAADARARQAHAEEALARAQKLENVGRVTGGVAHDFNNMLGVVVGALEMILRQADNPERVRRLGEAALAAGRRGERVTRELLAFARRQDEGAPSLDAAAVVAGLEPRLRRAADGAALTLEGPSFPVQAHVDPVELEAALEALVANAAAAAPGGSVLVRAEPTQLNDGEVAGLAAGPYLRLSVTDNGAGMTPEVLARASEPFFTTRPGSAGLGLAQVHGFARRVGGAVTLYGAPGQGATANLYVPAVEVEAEPWPRSSSGMAAQG